MRISKTKVGTINDDFIHNWKTLKVTDINGDIFLFKYDKRSEKFYSFFFDTVTSETELQEVDQQTSLLLEAEMDNPKTIRH